MPKILDYNQIQKIDRHYNRPIYLVHLLLDGLTLYFSDRSYSYNFHNYEDYLFDLSEIGNQMRNLGGYDNARVTLYFKNDKIRDKNYLIELFDDYPPEKKYVEIYRLLADTGETFGSDVSTEIFKGEMGQPYEIPDAGPGFKIDCSSMLFGKNVSLPLDVIDLADFPGADPDDVGKYRNIIIGNTKKVVCRWTVAGWVSTLTEDISAAATSITVTDSSTAPATPFTTICDNEKIRVTANSNDNLTVTRAYGGTTAATHSKGSIYYEQRGDFEAEVSCRAVKSIGDIYTRRRGELVRVLSGFTKYNNSGGRAKIVFTDKVKFEEKITITASTTPEEGTHIHNIPLGVYAQKECIPDGSSGATGHVNIIDGNPASYCAIAQDEGVQARFDGEANLGTISKVIIYVHKLDTNSTGYVQSPSGTNLQTLPAPAGLYRIVKTSGMLWTNSAVVIGGANGNQIAEIYKVVEYTPDDVEADTHPASGIDVDVLLSGNSVANILIGDFIECDVEGEPDDGSGTYTGTPGALIERPDHVYKFLLAGLLGFSSGDIDSAVSFAAAGALYASAISGGYKLGFVLHEVATEAMELFKQMDFCTRSNLFESGGKFKLFYNQISEGEPQIEFGLDNVEGKAIFSKTESADIRNKIKAHYFRDYSKAGGLGEIYQKVSEADDADSISKYGECLEDIEFRCIGDLPLMVDSVLEWVLSEKRELKKKVRFTAFWDASILEHCDIFTVVSRFWSGKRFKTIGLTERKQYIDLEGKQIWAMNQYELTFRPYDLYIRDDYCYACGVGYHDSKYWLTVAKIQLLDYGFRLIDLAEHDSGETGYNIGYYGIYVDADHNVYVCGRKGPSGDYAAVARKLDGDDLSSITWTATKEPTGDNDHVFLDILKDGGNIYVCGWRYAAAYNGLLYKLADSDGAESWGVANIATQCLGLGGLYDSHLWVFGENNTVRTLWKREDTDGSSDAVATFDSNSKGNFKKGFSDASYWYIAGNHIDGSNYEYGSSCRISKAAVIKDNEVLRNTVPTTITEYSNKIVGDGADGYVIGDYFDFGLEAYRTVMDKRPLEVDTSTWEVTHAEAYRNEGAIGVYGDHIFIGLYSPNIYSAGYIEKRKKNQWLPRRHLMKFSFLTAA